MTQKSQFVRRTIREQRHNEVLANSALLQAKNSKLEAKIKELESLTLW